MIDFVIKRSAPREGIYIHGLYLEGARWDSNLGVLAESKLKELHPSMPVIYVKVQYRIFFNLLILNFIADFINYDRRLLKISWT